VSSEGSEVSERSRGIITLSLGDDFYELLDAVAGWQGMSRSQVVRWLLLRVDAPRGDGRAVRRVREALKGVGR
jgi:Ribbon-helix-helix protein, copG family